ncbi:unnamed protein product [Nesidiocoris tenuis]|uniref:Uncharacterized protein n=1 Tax=Nesidiocoris tenuis TaxID=355587 RepID=A0A6H5GHD9_9HEMI|nr:unnamed protein product [Nesidiocoris tenuis]
MYAGNNSTYLSTRRTGSQSLHQTTRRNKVRKSTSTQKSSTRSENVAQTLESEILFLRDGKRISQIYKSFLPILQQNCLFGLMVTVECEFWSFDHRYSTERNLFQIWRIVGSGTRRLPIRTHREYDNPRIYHLQELCLPVFPCTRPNSTKTKNEAESIAQPRLHDTSITPDSSA